MLLSAILHFAQWTMVTMAGWIEIFLNSFTRFVILTDNVLQKMILFRQQNNKSLQM